MNSISVAFRNKLFVALGMADFFFGGREERQVEFTSLSGSPPLFL